MYFSNLCHASFQKRCGGIGGIAIMLLLFTFQAFAAEPLRILTFEVQPFGFLEDGTPTGLHYELSNLRIDCHAATRGASDER